MFIYFHIYTEAINCHNALAGVFRQKRENFYLKATIVWAAHLELELGIKCLSMPVLFCDIIGTGIIQKRIYPISS